VINFTSLPIDCANPVNWSHPLNAGRRAWWITLPGLAGGALWHDIAGGNHGVLTNGPVWRPSSRTNGWGQIQLDGSNDFIDIVNDPVAIKPSKFVSVACWINVAANNCVFIDAEQSTGVADTYQIYLDTNNNIRWNIRGSTITDTSTTISSNTWYRVLCTYDGAKARVYNNGEFKISTDMSGDLTYTTKNVHIGNNASTGGFSVNGFMNDVSVWDRSLSDFEVQQDYMMSLLGYPSVINRVGKWRLTYGAIQSVESALSAHGVLVVDGRRLKYGAGILQSHAIMVGAGMRAKVAESNLQGNVYITVTPAHALVSIGPGNIIYKMYIVDNANFEFSLSNQNET
jgi:hypothetical protein